MACILLDAISKQADEAAAEADVVQIVALMKLQHRAGDCREDEACSNS
jgi:hypothetical protein